MFYSLFKSLVLLDLIILDMSCDERVGIADISRDATIDWERLWQWLKGSFEFVIIANHQQLQINQFSSSVNLKILRSKNNIAYDMASLDS